MKNILITGGSGFIGSNFVDYILDNSSDLNVFNLDLLTYAASRANNSKSESNERYTFIEGDICDQALVRSIFQKNQITDVIHFAAESHVDNSITEPDKFIDTNIKGTFNLLHAAYETWMESPNSVRNKFTESRFHHISTDEVYGTLGDTGTFREDDPFKPNSPYSASKASSDLLVRSYNSTYGLNTIVTNCSNNYGPRQHDEKLIPTIIRNALSNKRIPIYGSGKNVRDWLYVEDHCSAIYTAFIKGKDGQTYNVGGECELTNIDLCNLICEKLDQLVPTKHSYCKQIEFVDDRAGHDWRYAIDCTKITTQLSWSPKQTIESGLNETIKWYVNKYNG